MPLLIFVLVFVLVLLFALLFVLVLVFLLLLLLLALMVLRSFFLGRKSGRRQRLYTLRRSRRRRRCRRRFCLYVASTFVLRYYWHARESADVDGRGDRYEIVAFGAYRQMVCRK